MFNNLKSRLMSKLKYQYIIKDPFPEHSQYKMYTSRIKQVLGLENKPREISIWEAYRMGQQDVYSRLEAILDSGFIEKIQEQDLANQKIWNEYVRRK